MNIFEQHLSKAMKICSRKETCIYDIQKKFEQWQTPFDLHNKIISALKEEKFIDQKRFAFAYAKDKFEYNSWGKIKIAFSLKQKKIEQNNISDALNSISDTDYFKKIEKIISLKIKSTKEKDAYKLKAKVYRHIASKGFEPEKFNSILNQAIEQKTK